MPKRKYAYKSLTESQRHLAYHGCPCGHTPCQTMPPVPDDGGMRLVRHLVALLLRNRPSLRPLADQLISEAEHTLCRAATTWNPDKARFTTWVAWNLRGAILRLVRPIERERKYMGRVVVISVFESGGNDPDESCQPEARPQPCPGLALDAREATNRVLRHLTPREREAIWLTRGEGLTLEEAGKAMGGISRERVRQLIERGLRRLHVHGVRHEGRAVVMV